MPSRSYFTRHVEIVPSFKVTHDLLRNSFFPSTAIEWNKTDKNICKSEKLNIFKRSNLYSDLKTEFITTINRIKSLTRLRVRLSHLREHSFQDTLNLICNCGKDIQTTSYYLLHCPVYLQERMPS